MKKQQFIRETAALFVAAHHLKPSLDDAITWSLALNNRLIERGYWASPNGSDNRKSRDYYKQLDKNQADLFDKFWESFNYKNGKNRAAMKFIQLWQTIKNEQSSFLQGASIEAAARLGRETTPPMAELWLNELRWQDAKITTHQKKAKKLDAQDRIIREASSELHHFESLLNRSKDDAFLNAEVKRLKEKLGKLKNKDRL